MKRWLPENLDLVLVVALLIGGVVFGVVVRGVYNAKQELVKQDEAVVVQQTSKKLAERVCKEQQMQAGMIAIDATLKYAKAKAAISCNTTSKERDYLEGLRQEALAATAVFKESDCDADPNF